MYTPLNIVNGFIPVTQLSYGEIVQLARTIGSYPIGGGFESLSRYKGTYSKLPCGEMVYSLDLKSNVRNGHAGSNPA